MSWRVSDIIPLSEARALLIELAEDLVGSGAEKVLTKNGSSNVALVDAQKRDDDTRRCQCASTNRSAMLRNVP
jgi:hypothetical protein